jgi:tricorn protease
MKSCDRFSIALATLVVLVLATASVAAEGVEPHGGMLRFPDVSADRIVFSYADDLWLVPREGGEAVPLASPPGPEAFAKFSPDGERVAFTGNYDGDQDLYVLPVGGGIPLRVTHHPDSEQLCDWTPEGNLIFHQNGRGGLYRQVQLFTVSAEGGLPVRMPVPYGANGSVSPDGNWLAYNLHPRDFATWKRYRGGWATDVWLFGLKDGSAKTITDWEGTDTLPMWHGKTVYYLSDGGPNHRLNIWAYDTDSGDRRQVTRLDEFDVKWPSIGPGPDGKGEIVFQHGSGIHLLDLATEKVTRVNVVVPGARPTLRPQRVDARKFIDSFQISPTAKRAVLGARGDIWTVPAKHGSPRNLTRTSGVGERLPAWSPDGRQIAYFADATGEYELYVRPADGSGEARQVTRGNETFFNEPRWSPDSKMLAFYDKAGRVMLYDFEDEELRELDRNPWGFPSTLSFSPDSRWLAYTKGLENRSSAVFIYDLDSGTAHQVTSGMFNDGSPTFDRKGEFLYYQSAREFRAPIYEDVGSTFVYAGLGRILAVPLNAEVENPFAPKSDEETPDGEDEEEDDEDGKDEKGKKDGDNGDDEDEGEDEEEKEPEPVEIDLEGFEARAIVLPPSRGRFGQWMASSEEGALIFVRFPVQRGPELKPSIQFFDPRAEEKEREEKTVLGDAAQFEMSADGKKLLVPKNGSYVLVEPKPDQKAEDALSLDGMEVAIDPRAEWRQIFMDAWRIQRDFFYVDNMHGIDWEATRKQYETMLADCVSRRDVSYVISEMISELNIGHAYYFGGDYEDEAERNVGMLGVDFEAHEGAYRIARILRGGAWDVDARGPLDRPELEVEEGDYVLAVNGLPLDVAQDPWAPFVGLADKTVTLTVSSKPDPGDDDEETRQVAVKTVGHFDEIGLRYRAWVEANRRFVEEQTDGKVGYIHVPDTGIRGQNELFRQFYGQVDRAALIVDERWNGGGQIPSRFIELLNRPRSNYWARRDGKDWPWPPDSHQGPKCMLINGPSGSGGDLFPWYFRFAELGPLIGRRTWGGLVGLSGNPPLIDGGYTAVPTFGFYEIDGTWGVEGHGVDPDIPVMDDPAAMAQGKDPQLDRAIEEMLTQIEKNPYTPPGRPEPPDRSGMGIREEDK